MIEQLILKLTYYVHYERHSNSSYYNSQLSICCRYVETQQRDTSITELFLVSPVELFSGETFGNIERNFLLDYF